MPAKSYERFSLPSLKSYVYVIRCLANNKIYVGKANQPFERFQRHISEAKNGSSTPFHRALRKYGYENFILECLYPCRSEKNAYRKERDLIFAYESYRRERGYNLVRSDPRCNDEPKRPQRRR